jgi:hypothetical protein
MEEKKGMVEVRGKNTKPAPRAQVLPEIVSL